MRRASETLTLFHTKKYDFRSDPGIDTLFQTMPYQGTALICVNIKMGYKLLAKVLNRTSDHSSGDE